VRARLARRRRTDRGHRGTSIRFGIMAAGYYIYTITNAED